MVVEKLNEMPQVFKTRMAFRELLNAIVNSKDGEILSFTKDDKKKKVSVQSIRTIIEKNTNKIVNIVKTSDYSVAIKILSKNEIEQEKKNREQRSKEMKKKLSA